MEKFITHAFQNIKKRINVESSLKIIQYTLKNSRSFSMETIINRLEKELNIIDEVIEAVLQNKDISDEAIGSLFLFLK
jgi:energy-converting hydrogenase A subunit M